MSINMEHIRAVEATLFASEEALSKKDIISHVGEEVDVDVALHALVEHYQGRGIELVKRGGKWHFQTAADLAYLLRKETDQLRKLSRAAIETLSIIAYHAPVSRAEIESIRVMQSEWVKTAGRREVPGRPLLYNITDQFLSHFGLHTRKDLPGLRDLKASGLLDPVDMVMEEMELQLDDDHDDAIEDANDDENDAV